MAVRQSSASSGLHHGLLTGHSLDAWYEANMELSSHATEPQGMRIGVGMRMRIGSRTPATSITPSVTLDGYGGG